MASRKTNNCNWIELAGLKPDGKMVRNHFVRTGDAAAVRQWRSDHENTDLYATVCVFENPDRNSRYVCDLFFDIDADNLGEAQCEAKGICDLLIRRWEIESEWLEIFFSGAKGLHIRVPYVVFGTDSDGNVMPIYQHLARRIAHEGFTHIDLGVYQASRVLRLPNSINSKTGLYKIPLEYKELADLDVQDICEIARAPRQWDTMALPASECPKAMGWMGRAQDWQHRRQRMRSRPSNYPGRSDGWRVPPCVRRIEEQAVLEDGFRHAIYFNLARFYAWIGMHPDEAVDRLQNIDGRNPIRDPDYIERAVFGARKYPGFKGCPNSTLERFCNPDRCPFACIEHTAMPARGHGQAQR